MTDAAAPNCRFKYYNEDLAPTSVSQRTWTTYHNRVSDRYCPMFPSFTYASSWWLWDYPWLAVFNVALGNLIILIPFINSHAGTKYGTPSLYCQADLGVGAHIPSRQGAGLRWCAIQCDRRGAFVTMSRSSLPVSGSSGTPFIGFGLSFFIYWITVNVPTLLILEALGAPILVI